MYNWLYNLLFYENAADRYISKIFGAVRPRSPKWNQFKNKWLKKNPNCIICGSTKYTIVHHIKPFHLFPQFELDESNVVTICENPKFNHHLYIAHQGNYCKYNKTLIEDIPTIKRILGLTSTDIRL